MNLCQPSARCKYAVADLLETFREKLGDIRFSECELLSNTDSWASIEWQELPAAQNQYLL